MLPILFTNEKMFPFQPFFFLLINSLYVVSQLSQFSLACKCEGKIKYAKLKLKYQDILH